MDPEDKRPHLVILNGERGLSRKLVAFSSFWVRVWPFLTGSNGSKIAPKPVFPPVP